MKFRTDRKYNYIKTCVHSFDQLTWENLAAGVPDTPTLFITSDGIATWREVNSRSERSVDFYLIEAIDDGLEVGKITVDPNMFTSTNGNITQNLSDNDLNLQVGQRYNICVTAKNNIGQSTPGCDGSYIHMEADGIYMYTPCKIVAHV